MSNKTDKNSQTPAISTIKSKNIYAKITDLIIERLEQGEIAWENPVINNCRPQNLVTGSIYRGINPIILSRTKTPFFMTFKQAKKIGANVKKGAKSLPIVFWDITTKTVENEEGEAEEKKSYFLKYYNVFNISDIENIPAKYMEKTKLNKNNNIEILTAEQIISNYKNTPNAPKFEHCMGTPHYSPANDTIRMPKKEYFKSSNHFYSTMFHEILHSSGLESRLNRFKSHSGSLSHGSKEYAKEELTAELGASFLMAETGEKINIKNRTAYIQSWLKALKNDCKILLQAAGKAEKAVNYILNK